ncbi:glutaminyl-peptide cyclotransferase-like [Drosophila nasuta]|uniref:glutaminyl-peptide cyclotransferase-like n=1 Tax=Drosophila nasuta TaxID=42062 RepID=UPI00295F2F8E|nr:glutaminyl-peptide cyclotransferase-like [Drosophila nasuta]
MSEQVRLLLILLTFGVICQYYLILWIKNVPPPNMVSNETYFNTTLEKLLRQRFPGSIGHSRVSNLLTDTLKELGFTTVRDEHLDGMKFINLLGIMNTQATNYLMLCCHYDSKYIENHEIYVGATDGAVSCAMLLTVIKNLNSYLLGEFKKRTDIGLLLVLFDGHESFEEVIDDFNSLNGSRHFAEAELIPLQSIELAIAFNLIGAPNQIYMSHYENTYELHSRLADIEQHLREAGRLSNSHQLFHKLKDHDSDIEDDHYPFLMEGVPVMHIVPHTFPEVWHTDSDNLRNLHFPTIRNMNLIITQFVYEYLHNHSDEISRLPV